MTPLSFGQQRMWFLQQLDPSSPLYNTYRCWRLRGALNTSALERALKVIVARHSVLRAAIQLVEGEACQVVDDAFSFDLPVLDLRQSSATARETAAEEITRQEAKTPFDLAQGPLFRVKLLRLDDDDHVLVISMHHVITDGWSFGVLYGEINTLYQAFAEGGASPLPDLPVQYGDYAIWQRDFIEGPRQEELISYWSKQLAQLSPLQLPTDRIRPSMPAFRGGRQGFSIGKTLTAQLKSWYEQEGVTLFTALLTCFNVLLYRDSGQEDIAVGTLVHNRLYKEIEPLIGMFMNTLVIRSDLSANPTFRELLQRVRKTSKDAFAHQELPFDRLVDELHPERDSSRNPLFQVAISYQNTPGQVLELPGLITSPFGSSDLGPHQRGNDTSKFDLTLTLLEADGEIQGKMEYSTDLFDDATVRRMIDHLQTLMEEVAADPDQRICEIPLLQESERREVLAMGLGPRRASPDHLRIQQLFGQQVARSPHAAAVVFESQSLTYGELNAQANQLAHYLQGRGIGPEARVGLCLDRSVEAIVAVLGILKAGGAYVPLDPNYPRERLAFIAKDAGLRVILTKEKFQQPLSQMGAELIRIDTDWPLIGREAQSTPGAAARADSLAYVIYTSGSTGRSKGVEVEHSQVVDYVDGIVERLALPAGSSFAMVSPLTADLGHTMLYPALATGGTLHLISEDRAADAVALAEYFRRHQPDCLKIVPSHFAGLLMGPDPADVVPQKCLVLGGEACPWHLVEKVQALRPDCRVINHYGPTEATVGVTTYQAEMPDRTIEHSPTVPIGRPLSNSSIYILDSRGHPAPVRVAGEVYIGGRGLARGYLNAPALTAEKFVPDPYGGEPGARLYKTGDRARFHADGTIEFLGRVDHQVKLRGFRVELGEVEAALSRHERVQAAVVVVREKEGVDKQLVAYVVPEQGQLSASDLRQFLKLSLPEYMVPAIFVTLNDLPLTTNGKVDRRALPAPAATASEPDNVFEAPHPGPEQILAGIWQQLLRLDQVGRRDNFFELGGDSILSIQMGARASQVGLRVTPKQIFQHQTIAELAKVAGIYQAVSAEQGLVTGAVPLTPIQNWFFEQRFIEPHHWNMAWVLEASEPLDPERMEEVVAALVMHHDGLRLRLTQSEAGWQQKLVVPDRETPFTFFDWSNLSAGAAEEAWRLETGRLQASLSLEDGPLVRVALMHFGADGPDRVLIVLHHLAFDGVSWRIFLEDLQTAYDQLHKGQPVQLPPKTTSIRRWAEGLLEHTRAGALEPESGYWRELVNTPCERLPRDVVDGDNTVASTRTVVVALTREETEALLREIPEVYHTQINDVLLTALLDALARWTEQEAVLINLEGHGREEILEGADLSRTIGWFTAKFPLLLKQIHAAHPGESLKAVKEQLRQIPNRGVGYGLLKFLNRDASLQTGSGGWADPEVSFNYLGQFDQAFEVSTLFAESKATPGPMRSARGHRANVIEIIAVVSEGRLKTEWLYSENIHLQPTIEALASNYLAALRAVILHCQTPQAGGYTPSDFPLAGVGQRDLDEMLNHLSSGGDRPRLDDLYPLTPLQQGIWFHELAAPESSTYFRRIVTRLQGEIDSGLLKRAWQEVMNRHGILRTSLVWEELDQPLQIVHPTMELPWRQEDWRDGLAQGEEQRLEAFLQQDRARGFDLTQPPLMRLTMIQVTEQKSLLIWSYHHLILDRWSIEVVQQEVWAAYQALQQGLALETEKPQQFREYLAWLTQQDQTGAERYWRSILKGFTAPTLLDVAQGPQPKDRQSHDYDAQQLTLSQPATAALERFARQHQVTLNTLVQGAWAFVLGRYGNTEDVVFGITSSGRAAELDDIETMVGMFISTLPVRVNLDRSQRVASWLREMQAQQVGMRQYEYAPLFEIQKWSDVAPGTPLFNSLFIFENTPGGEAATTGPSDVSVEHVYLNSDLKTDYPFNLACFVDGPLHLLATYDTGCFEGPAIHRVLSHVQQALIEMVAAPEQTLGSLSLINEAERHQLLVGWNATERAYPREATLAERFEAQVATTPDAVAVAFAEQTLTYAELNTRANRFAHYLHHHCGVTPEACVGLCMERGVDMVVGLLGIVKAGGVYVPLDPATPPERLTFMLQDTGASLVVTEDDLRSVLPAQWTGQVVAMDTASDDIAQSPDANFTCNVTADHLAYVMYTSGSTGQPKGIGIPQRGVLRLVLESDYIELNASDRVAQVATISFDAATFEIWGALLNGSQLVIIPRTIALSPQDLAAHLQHCGITTMFLTTALFNQMAREAPEAFQDMRHLLVGGEAADPQAFTAVLQAAPPQRLLHVYGPTENTTFTTWHLTTSVSAGETTVPIGQPIGNTQVYVLDAAMQPVPVGVYGELYVGGDGLARNYLQRPALTAEKFVPNPFSDVAGARLYRTGDLVRRRADGAIEFLGRQDHQVKVRGFRIELGEIEAALARHPDIAEAVALVRDDAPGEKRLVAYVVPVEAPPSPVDLRQFLKQSLPEYMLPAAFVSLEALPLTPNGKLDRRVLPEPDGSVAGLGDNFVAPRNPTEAELARIWEDLLQVKQVGVHDNFFELGGHSLLATRVVSQIRQEFHVVLKLAQFFETPTIAELGKSLEGLLWISAGRPSEHGAEPHGREEGEI